MKQLIRFWFLSCALLSGTASLLAMTEKPKTGKASIASLSSLCNKHREQKTEEYKEQRIKTYKNNIYVYYSYLNSLKAIRAEYKLIEIAALSIRKGEKVQWNDNAIRLQKEDQWEKSMVEIERIEDTEDKNVAEKKRNIIEKIKELGPFPEFSIDFNLNGHPYTIKSNSIWLKIFEIDSKWASEKYELWDKIYRAKAKKSRDDFERESIEVQCDYFKDKYWSLYPENFLVYGQVEIRARIY